jgi:hypothetical protein
LRTGEKAKSTEARQARAVLELGGWWALNLLCLIEDRLGYTSVYV